jgi:hypothetical protein
MSAVITPSQCPLTRESMRVLGEKSANDFLDNAAGIRDRGVTFAAWREDCYAEIVREYEGHVDLANLLTAWGKGFDSVQPLGPTPKEMDLLNAYRMTDDRGRDLIGNMASGQAEDWPRNTFSVPILTAEGVA